MLWGGTGEEYCSGEINIALGKQMLLWGDKYCSGEAMLLENIALLLWGSNIALRR
ncbi:MAG TPA: hypothetical protein PLB63_09960 [Planctomycetota bacterium]|nr:hypothetical protein [Planctomycetota bacterium]HQB01262.1 hypothetical protein [Planctomycetota bacterium]